MCGLAGIARLDGGVLGAEADALLDAMARVVAHRGPDDRELLRDGPVGLAFTRLSLVDPDGGAQPLVSEDGSLVLIANGEIYNHRELAAGLTAGWRPRTGSICSAHSSSGTDYACWTVSSVTCVDRVSRCGW